MKTRAAVLKDMTSAPPYSHSRPLEIREIVLDPPGPDEVLVRIRAAGLCHSDLSVINGNRPRPMPMTLGHEAAGEVVSLGANVDDLVPGDHVVLTFMPSCGHCLPCAEGRPALCEPGARANGAGTLLSGEVRLHENGAAIFHHLGCSAFAEHAVVSRRSLVKIDKTLPFTEAALFGCAVLTGVGAVINTARVQAGQTVAVIGLGGVGLAAVLGAVCAGATQIVAVDLSDDKLTVAKALGATATFNARDPDLMEQIRALTDGGVDVALEFAGSEKALSNAYRMTRRGGTTVTAGLPGPDTDLKLNIVSLVAEERTLKGSYIGTCVPPRDIARYVALYRQGKLPVGKLLSGTLRLEEINEGFDRLDKGEAIRLIIEL
ncbi:zinc-dependent alcohol dehydrogenase family protein [Vreelandella malpeensis]|uniref:Zinc-dependent alcohol dehydrogenase family protein n=1 Tax=Vreelandella malpeensis TaxID=1172368 RepID=A0ABS8DXF9_9GAMM|nr:zinc-dependent alcohol dehydrogenase family protein [Halomonas malpeensis]MCB8890653.1 zinc-dependent alcohol dehydrogenase family protein [Halomonas malpeensis]